MVAEATCGVPTREYLHVEACEAPSDSVVVQLAINLVEVVPARTILLTQPPIERLPPNLDVHSVRYGADLRFKRRNRVQRHSQAIDDVAWRATHLHRPPDQRQCNPLRNQLAGSEKLASRHARRVARLEQLER